MDKQLNVTFRFQPWSSSPDGLLLQYLKQQVIPVKNEMVLRALRAFWLAEAYQNLGGKRPQELKRLAMTMIGVLEDQANYLRAVFGIERAIPYPVSTQMISPVVGVAAHNPSPEVDSISHLISQTPIVAMDDL